MRLNEKVLQFSTDSATVEPQYHGVITALANALGDVLPCYSNEHVYIEKACTENKEKHWLESVFIEGHTDNVGYLSNNLKLSTQRAANTYVELTKVRSEVETLKNSDNQPLLSVSGYADKRPLEESQDNATPEHRQMNRRIELRIIMATPKQEQVDQPIIKSIKGKIE